MTISTSRILLLICLFLLCSADKYLYDLVADPTESENLYYKTYYYSTVQTLEDKITSWSGKLHPADTDGTGGDKYKLQLAKWADCGCVDTWIDDTVGPRSIKQIYEPSTPPHIVFVLVDDLGWNDIGYQSTYQYWATPAIDLLASEGVKLTFYFTHDSCVPSRGALLTGRYSIRLGLHEDGYTGAELPTSEVTLAEELKSAGYKTNLIGKWHLGQSSPERLPSSRGFDYSYGYFNGYIDYWTKSYNGYSDLHENGLVVTNENELSSDIHSAYLFQSKAEAAIANHAENYPHLPMFLYYSLQLVHFPYQPPDEFSNRCYSSDTYTKNFCGLTLMLDEVIANLTCALRNYNMMDNTVLIFASDNGGTAEEADSLKGNSVPFRGHKFSYNRGGISAPAFIHSPLIPDDMKGKEYPGLMHVTDWLPTIMGLATEGKWAGSYMSNDIDGVDMWEAIMGNLPSPRNEVVNYISANGLYASYQYGNYKYDKNLDLQDYDQVLYTPVRMSEEYEHSCSAISLMNDEEYVAPAYTKWHIPSHVYNQIKPSLFDKFSKTLISLHWSSIASFLALIGILLTVAVYATDKTRRWKHNEQELSSMAAERHPLIR